MWSEEMPGTYMLESVGDGFNSFLSKLGSPPDVAGTDFGGYEGAVGGDDDGEHDGDEDD